MNEPQPVRMAENNLNTPHKAHNKMDKDIMKCNVKSAYQASVLVQLPRPLCSQEAPLPPGSLSPDLSAPLEARLPMSQDLVG